MHDGRGRCDHVAGALLGALRLVLAGRANTDRVTLRDLMAALEETSFPVVILLFALLLVSPLSAIPGATTLLGLTIAGIVAQLIMGQRQVWLPGVLLDRSLPVGRIATALKWLDRPVGWIDARLRPRIHWISAPPFALAPKALVLVAAICAPLMELIPGSGTSIGVAISVFAAGLLARDGVYVLAGACMAAVLPVLLWLLVT